MHPTGMHLTRKGELIILPRMFHVWSLSLATALVTVQMLQAAPIGACPATYPTIAIQDNGLFANTPIYPGPELVIPGLSGVAPVRLVIFKPPVINIPTQFDLQESTSQGEYHAVRNSICTYTDWIDCWSDSVLTHGRRGRRSIYAGGNRRLE